RGLHGADIGIGNRTAISAMLVAHAVVWDGAARRLYVSRAPRGLADFVAYDVGPFLDGAVPEPTSVRVPGPPAIPTLPDPQLAERVERARDLIRSSDAARSDDPAAALRDAEEAVLLTDRAPPALLAR